MSSYTIGQLAGRSGFSASALRYYEDIGLVSPARRSDSGYRLYDEQALSRLAFIARAKQLGCTLGEITDLVELWDGERCGPVQRQLHGLVTDKLHDADRRIAELTAFTSQLRGAAAQLSGGSLDGPCDDGCACMLEPADPPIACSLGAGEVQDRLSEWEHLLASAARRLRLPSGGVRVEFDETVDPGELARLVVAEQRCCAFFRFAITVDDRGIGLDVGAPSEALDLVSALFG